MNTNSLATRLLTEWTEIKSNEPLFLTGKVDNGWNEQSRKCQFLLQVGPRNQMELPQNTLLSIHQKTPLSSPENTPLP